MPIRYYSFVNQGFHRGQFKVNSFWWIEFPPFARTVKAFPFRIRKIIGLTSSVSVRPGAAAGNGGSGGGGRAVGPVGGVAGVQEGDHVGGQSSADHDDWTE